MMLENETLKNNLVGVETQAENKPKVRQTNFEILRIISILLIIAHHFSVHSNYSNVDFFPKILIDILAVGGKVGVILFVLISGYFISDSSFKLKKLIKLLLAVCFYSITIYLIFVLCNLVTFDMDTFIKICLPTTFSGYWFNTTFIIAYALSPLICVIIKNYDRKKCFTTIVGLIVIQTLQTFFNISFLSTVGWFLTIMMCGMYIKTFNPKLLNKKYLMLFSFTGIYILIILINIFLRQSF